MLKKLLLSFAIAGLMVGGLQAGPITAVASDGQEFEIDQKLGKWLHRGGSLGDEERPSRITSATFKILIPAMESMHRAVEQSAPWPSKHDIITKVSFGNASPADLAAVLTAADYLMVELVAEAAALRLAEAIHEKKTSLKALGIFPMLERMVVEHYTLAYRKQMPGGPLVDIEKLVKIEKMTEERYRKQREIERLEIKARAGKCPICLEKKSAAGEESLAYKTSCGHYFHISCLMDVLRHANNQLCPICRQNIHTGEPSRSRSLSPQASRATTSTPSKRVRRRGGKQLAISNLGS